MAPECLEILKIVIKMAKNDCRILKIVTKITKNPQLNCFVQLNWIFWCILRLILHRMVKRVFFWKNTTTWRIIPMNSGKTAKDPWKNLQRSFNSWNNFKQKNPDQIKNVKKWSRIWKSNTRSDSGKRSKWNPKNPEGMLEESQKNPATPIADWDQQQKDNSLLIVCRLAFYSEQAKR